MTSPSESPPSMPTGWAQAGILRPVEDVETAQLGPNQVAFPLTPEDNGGRFSLTIFTPAPLPAPGPPPHLHEDADEAIYVLDGALEMGIGEQRMTGTAGSVLLVPRGTLRAIANPGPEPVRMLIVTPPGDEGFWREVAALQADLGGRPDAQTVLALQRRYHLRTGGQARRFD